MRKNTIRKTKRGNYIEEIIQRELQRGNYIERITRKKLQKHTERYKNKKTKSNPYRMIHTEGYEQKDKQGNLKRKKYGRIHLEKHTDIIAYGQLQRTKYKKRHIQKNKQRYTMTDIHKRLNEKHIQSDTLSYVQEKTYRVTYKEKITQENIHGRKYNKIYKK